MTGQTKNVFISHLHEDDAGLGKLKSLLAKQGMNIKDSSVNASNPNNANSEAYIKSSILAPRIDWAGTVIVYVSPETKNSAWVNWEIEHAHAKESELSAYGRMGQKTVICPTRSISMRTP